MKKNLYIFTLIPLILIIQITNFGIFNSLNKKENLLKNNQIENYYINDYDNSFLIYKNENKYIINNLNKEISNTYILLSDNNLLINEIDIKDDLTINLNNDNLTANEDKGLDFWFIIILAALSLILIIIFLLLLIILINKKLKENKLVEQEIKSKKLETTNLIILNKEEKEKKIIETKKENLNINKKENSKKEIIKKNEIKKEKDYNVSELKGIGPKITKYLKKWKITTMKELLFFAKNKDTKELIKNLPGLKNETNNEKKEKFNIFLKEANKYLDKENKKINKNK